MRVLIRDHEEFYQKALSYFLQAEQKVITIVVLPSIVIESIYVLQKTYKIPKNQFIPQIHTVINSPSLLVPEKAILAYALKLYSTRSIDFIDCYLASYATQHQWTVLSFDRDFKKLL